MKKLLLLLLFITAGSIYSENINNEIVGTFVTSVYDINFKDDSFKAVFWIWWKQPLIGSDTSISLSPQNRIEITNAREYTKLKEYQDRYKDVKTGIEYHYTMAKYSATINHNWDIKRFPMDSQTPEIIIESVEYNSDQLVYTKDTTGSIIDENIKINGWNILSDKVDIITDNKNYKTNFGFNNGDFNQQIYPRFTISFNIKREGIVLLFNYFIGFIIAFILCCIIYFIDVSKLELRIFLAFAAILTSFFSKFFADFTTPYINRLTLFSGSQFITFMTIILTLIVSLVSYKYLGKNKVKISKKINKISGVIILLLHIELLVLLFIFI